ncbi:MAG: hypothetical protein ABWY49_01475 [Rhizobium sp.]
MILGMDEAELQAFIERISATAIANQAILKCYLRGIPMTTDNVILFVGDFIDPAQPEFTGLIGKIEMAIEDVVERPWLVDETRDLLS